MTRFKPGSSGVIRDCSVNYATQALLSLGLETLFTNHDEQKVLSFEQKMFHKIRNFSETWSAGMPLTSMI